MGNTGKAPGSTNLPRWGFTPCEVPPTLTPASLGSSLCGVQWGQRHVALVAPHRTLVVWMGDPPKASLGLHGSQPQGGCLPPAHL